MAKEALYLIKHLYEVDGGFGDAIDTEEDLFTATETVAKAYVEKWNNPHVYAEPYAKLMCGELICVPLPRRIESGDINKSPSEILKYTSWENGG